MNEAPIVSLPPETVQGLLDLARDLAELHDLPAILDRINQAISEVAGFEIAILNRIEDDRSLLTISAAGHPAASEALLGQRVPEQQWKSLLAAGQQIGAMVFNPTAFVGQALDHQWIHEDEDWYAPHSHHADAWRREFALAVPMYDSTDELLGLISVDLPVSGRFPDETQLATLELVAREAERAIDESTRLEQSVLDGDSFESLFESAPSPTAICLPDGSFARANAMFGEQFGKPSDLTEFDRQFGAHFPPGGLEAAVRKQFSGTVNHESFTVRVPTATGPQWYEVVVRGVAFAAAVPTRVSCTFDDITGDRLLGEQYRHDAAHDPLTALLNRRGLIVEAQALVARTTNCDTIAVMFGDLDDFKQINDTYGHSTGDSILIAMSRELERLAPPDSVVARIGGDEFVIVTPTADASLESAIAEAGRLAEHITVTPPGTDVPVGIQFGVAVDGPGGPRDFTALFAEADVALHKAKDNKPRRSAPGSD